MYPILSALLGGVVIRAKSSRTEQERRQISAIKNQAEAVMAKFKYSPDMARKMYSYFLSCEAGGDYISVWFKGESKGDGEVIS